MSDRPTAVELIKVGHAEGDRVVAMRVAWEAIATLTDEWDALAALIEQYEDAIIENDNVLHHREAMFQAVRPQLKEQDE